MTEATNVSAITVQAFEFTLTETASARPVIGNTRSQGGCCPFSVKGSKPRLLAGTVAIGFVS
jgi:hypothetical protein